MKTLVALWLVMVSLCVHAAPGVVEDRPEQKFRMTWQGVAISASTPIPAGPVTRTISLRGEMQLYDTSGLTGIGNQVHVERVEDGEGNVIYEAPANRRPYQHFETHFLHHHGGPPGAVPSQSVSATFPLNGPLPEALGLVVARLETLRTPKPRQLKLPLVVSEEWTKINDDISVRVSEVTPEEERLRVKLCVTGVINAASRLVPRRNPHGPFPTPGMYVERIVLVDDQGQDSAEQRPRTEMGAVHREPLPGGGVRIRRLDKLSYLVMQLPVPPGRTYQQLRIEFVDTPIEPLKFELRDIALPQNIE